MKKKLIEYWNALTLWALARRCELHDCPHGNDLVTAILLRQELERQGGHHALLPRLRFAARQRVQH